MIIYRISSARYPANNGAGASLYGGRWNHRGTPVIYAAASRALCALEILANAGELAGDYTATSIEIPDDLPMTAVSADDLPPDWNAGTPTNTTRDMGNEWAEGLSTAALSVPSAVIPSERNYILNPRHPDFQRIQFGAPERFLFDERLNPALRRN